MIEISSLAAPLLALLSAILSGLGVFVREDPEELVLRHDAGERANAERARVQAIQRRWALGAMAAAGLSMTFSIAAIFAS